MRTQKDVDGTKTYYYYDSDKNLIGLTKGNATLLFYYDSDGNVTSFKYGDTMYYYIKNLQGDVVKIINQSGTEVAGYVYDAWGNIKSVSGEPILRELNPFRYRSYVYDSESGLYYLQSRYYDPFTGRFINADTYYDTGTGSPLSTNMFAYCENNVVMKYDLFGKNAWWIQAANSAHNAGHTSLLIQESKGNWWYFYWGEYIQLIYIGTTTFNNIKTTLDKKIKMASESDRKKIKNNETYNGVIKYSGNFKPSLDYVKKLVNDEKSKKIKWNTGTKNSPKYSYQTEKNSKYTWYDNNCMQVSVDALLKGTFNRYNEKMKNTLKMVRKWIYPNQAYCYLYYVVLY